MADFDDEDWDDEVAQGDSDHQRIDRAPDDAQKLRPWTVVALILNRTIGKLTARTITPRTPFPPLCWGLFSPLSLSMSYFIFIQSRRSRKTWQIVLLC
jgi:hypothetical protein